MSSDSSYIPEKIFFKVKASKLITYIVLAFWAMTTLFPLLWVFLNSFKNNDEIFRDSLALPKKFISLKSIFENYRSLGKFSETGILKAYTNSFVMSGGTLIFILLLGGMAAFYLARFKFKYTKQIKAYLIASMLIPQFAVIVPNFILMRSIHVQGSYLSVIIPQTAGLMNFAILMLTSFMSAIPCELEEAAIIDGCSVTGIFRKVIVPLSIPAFVSVGIMIFLWSYNDLLTPLVYVSKENYPVTVLISQVQSLYSTDYGAMMAAVTITIVPVLLLYVFSQEYVIKGMTAGSVKG